MLNYNTIEEARPFIEVTAKEMFNANGKHYRIDCGSYLFSPKHSNNQMVVSSQMRHKQALLFDTCKNASSVLETGTYMGHSLLIMLCSNPMLKITTVDLLDRYCNGAIEVLRERFPQAQIDFIQGNSLEVLPTLTSNYNFFHLDGSHKAHIVEQEIKHCLKLVDKTMSKTYFVIDDYNQTQQACEFLSNNYEVYNAGISGGYNYNWRCSIVTSTI